MAREDDILARLTAAMEAISSRFTDSDRDDRLARAFDQLAEAQKTIAAGQNQTLRQIHKPSNETPPGISVYNPRGDKDFPRPPLKCKILTPFFRPDDAQSLTREEIELWNLLEPGEYRIRRVDGTQIVLRVDGKKRAGTDEWEVLSLIHETAFSKDQFRQLPGQVDVLRQMYRTRPALHKKAQAIVTMDEEEALILSGQLNDGSVPEDGRVVSVGA